MIGTVVYNSIRKTIKHIYRQPYQFLHKQCTHISKYVSKNISKHIQDISKYIDIHDIPRGRAAWSGPEAPPLGILFVWPSCCDMTQPHHNEPPKGQLYVTLYSIWLSHTQALTVERRRLLIVAPAPTAMAEGADGPPAGCAAPSRSSSQKWRRPNASRGSHSAVDPG